MNKFEKIVIASDMDGTFLGKNSRLIQKNIEAIEYFCKNGGRFTFSTGRAPLLVKDALPDVANIINMPAITANGTCLYDFQRDSAIIEKFVRSEDILEVYKAVKESLDVFGYRASTRDGIVISDDQNPYNEAQLTSFPLIKERKVAAVDTWSEHKMYKVNIFAKEAELESIFPLLKERFSNRLCIVRGARYNIEMMPLATSKARLLKQCLAMLYPEENLTLCAVGDYYNDIEILRAAEIPACPKNAVDEVKRESKYCLCDHDEGVIADLVKRLEMYL